MTTDAECPVAHPLGLREERRKIAYGHGPPVCVVEWPGQERRQLLGADDAAPTAARYTIQRSTTPNCGPVNLEMPVGTVGQLESLSERTE